MNMECGTVGGRTNGMALPSVIVATRSIEVHKTWRLERFFILIVLVSFCNT